MKYKTLGEMIKLFKYSESKSIPKPWVHNWAGYIINPEMNIKILSDMKANSVTLEEVTHFRNTHPLLVDVVSIQDKFISKRVDQGCCEAKKLQEKILLLVNEVEPSNTNW
jgi:hypothetical protein